MSVRAIAWAFEQQVGNPLRKSVLICLANHHNDEKNVDPYPGIEAIAASTEMNEKSVRRHLDVLEEAELITSRPRGRGKVYRLSLPPAPGREFGEEASTPDSVSVTPDSLSGTSDSVSATPDTESSEPEGTDSNRKRTGESARRLATRLPADWRPSDDEIEFARNEGLDHDAIRRAADRFRDHWLAMPGQRGLKLDWPATWRNWVRKDAEDARRDRARPGGGRRAQREIQQDLAVAAGRVLARSSGPPAAGGGNSETSTAHGGDLRECSFALRLATTTVPDRGTARRIA